MASVKSLDLNISYLLFFHIFTLCICFASDVQKTCAVAKIVIVKKNKQISYN